MDEKIKLLQKWIDESNKIVAFTGAGCSTESGVPDFRSVDGLYNQKYAWPPEQILSHTFFERMTGEFYRYYRDKLIVENARPNPAHKYFAALEERGQLTAVVTQNIDGLHQAAGSKKVYELHGSLLRNYCTTCGAKYDVAHITACDGIPVCDKCGGVVRPDVVLYEEMLDDSVVTGAVRRIAEADMLIVGGTSLVVYPAAGLVNYYRGKKLVLINKTATPYDEKADLVINEKIGEVFSQLR